MLVGYGRYSDEDGTGNELKWKCSGNGSQWMKGPINQTSDEYHITTLRSLFY